MPKAYKVVFLVLFFCSCNQKKDKVISIDTNNDIITPTLGHTLSSKVVDSSTLRIIMGQFEPASDSNFIKIPLEYADQAGRYMQAEAFEAFVQMYKAALADSIRLQIKSAARNFDYQKGIWERKWTGETKLSTGEDASMIYTDSVDRAINILKYSSMPGTSRHHWGTDIDLNAFDNSWFESGAGLKLFQWLENHAHEFGYCRPYTAKDSLRPYGYNEEKWHWSYMPISEALTKSAVSFMSDSLITGFLGSGTASQIDVVNKYVLGINHSCLH